MSMLLPNAFVFLCLCVVWKTNDWLNLALKFLMLGMAMWNFATYLR